MRTFILAFVLLSAARVDAVTAVAEWDANTDGITTGYRLYYGLMPSVEDEGEIDAGLSTRVVVADLLPGKLYFFHVRAYAASGLRSESSTEVMFQTPAAPDPCSFPLGQFSVSIFVTGKLNKTGSGGAGSKAFITFQPASPNSPLTFFSIRANGVDVPDSVTEGTNLRAVGSLWFTIPQGMHAYSIYARNSAGCSRDQSTGFSTP